MASFFPTTTATDFVSAVTGVLSDNIGVVLAIFGAMFGIKFIFRLVNKSTKGHL